MHIIKSYSNILQTTVCNGVYNCIDRSDEDLDCIKVKEVSEEEKQEAESSAAWWRAAIVIFIAQFYIKMCFVNRNG